MQDASDAKCLTLRVHVDWARLHEEEALCRLADDHVGL